MPNEVLTASVAIRYAFGMDPSSIIEIALSSSEDVGNARFIPEVCGAGCGVAILAYGSPPRLPSVGQDLHPIFPGYAHLCLGGLLAAKLLQTRVSDRPHDVLTYTEDLLKEAGRREILLRRTHLLFESSLRINPLALARDLGRSYHLLFEWPGKLTPEGLVFGESGHPSHRFIPVEKVGFPILHLK